MACCLPGCWLKRVRAETGIKHSEGAPTSNLTPVAGTSLPGMAVWPHRERPGVRALQRTGSLEEAQGHSHSMQDQEQRIGKPVCSTEPVEALIHCFKRQTVVQSAFSILTPWHFKADTFYRPLFLTLFRRCHWILACHTQFILKTPTSTLGTLAYTQGRLLYKVLKSAETLSKTAMDKPQNKYSKVRELQARGLTPGRLHPRHTTSLFWKRQAKGRKQDFWKDRTPGVLLHWFGSGGLAA